GKPLGTGVNNSYVLWHDNGSLQAGVGDSGGGFGPQLNLAWMPQLGTWYHLAFTYDGVLGIQSLYINGVRQASNLISRTIGYDTHPLLIGVDSNNEVIGGFFGGKADEVRVWNVARSESEIQAAMSQSLLGTESGLVGYWRR